MVVVMVQVKNTPVHALPPALPQPTPPTRTRTLTLTDTPFCVRSHHGGLGDMGGQKIPLGI